MITDTDIQKMKNVFATKDDFDKKLKPVLSALKHIKHSLQTAIDVFDTQRAYHHKRLNTIEKNIGPEEQPYVPPTN